MATRTRIASNDTSIADFLTEPDTRPVINRNKIANVPAKKRALAVQKANTARGAKNGSSRQALKDRTNVNDADEVVDEDNETEPVKSKSRKRAQPDDDAPAAKRSKSAKAAKISEPVKAKRSRKAASPEPMPYIPETQPEQDVSLSIEQEPDCTEVQETQRVETSTLTNARNRSVSHQRRPPAYNLPARAKSVSQQPRSYSREGSASLAERRLADAETRRKLSDMTSKYEDMRLKYESLSELGNGAAETNFDRLKRATDQRAKDAADLIASLKKELCEARKSGSNNNAENAKLQTQLNTLQSSHEQYQAEAKELKKSLTDARNQVKSLNAKLDAAREAARKAAAESSKIPGSAIKSRNNDARHAPSNGSLDSAKEPAFKEELYRDLTGLIINSVKQVDGETVYSCIQTGHNGTLHFHLSIANDANQMNPKTPSNLSYEDAELAYEPFLDQSRDRDLIDILPEYLTEEICFPRGHAIKFYSKIVQSMMRNVIVEDE